MAGGWAGHSDFRDYEEATVTPAPVPPWCWNKFRPARLPKRALILPQLSGSKHVIFSAGAAGQALDHRAYGSELVSAPALEIQAAVAPPIPAALGIEGQHRWLDLRIEHDDAVAVCPLVITQTPVNRVPDRPRSLST